MKAISLMFLGLLSVAGIAVYSFLKPPPEASGPIEALAVRQTTPGASSTARVFNIVPAESEARFVIDEVLRGQPKTVVGATDQVAGQIAVDPNDSDTAPQGTVLVNARTFATDSTQRDRAIQNQILKTAEHEFITFTPTQVLGLTSDVSLGQPRPIQLVGDLTIAGVTRQVTFEATVTPETTDRLEGSARTTIRYADWGLSIPQVPAVTGVSESVRLELDFTATSA